MKSKRVSLPSVHYLVFFLVNGVAGYVLPRYDNAVYIQIEKGDHFGLVDLAFDHDIINVKSNFRHRSQKNKEFYRRFTVQALINCELLTFGLEDIDKMQLEFPEYFEELFMNTFRRLKKEYTLKIEALK